MWYERFPASVFVALKLNHSVRDAVLIPVQLVVQRVVRIIQDGLWFVL